MSLLKKDYLCQVTIVEGRELAGTDPSGTCDPFVKVTCGNAPAQATTTEDETNNPSWNQSFTFSKLSLTDIQLETWELKIECLDFNAFLSNELIGAYSLGLATLNRNSNHEFYNVWITLLHPEYGSTPRGYLLINCFIVGPDDVPPAHAIGEQMGLDEDAEDSDDEIDDLLTPEQRNLKKLKKKAIGVVAKPMIAKKSFQLSINVYKAEHLPKLGGSEVSPFVSARTCGLVERTHLFESNSNPIWNVKMAFPASSPILNDRITIRVWDQRPRSRDKLIASLPENPKDHDNFNISTLISRGGVLPCRWYNMYGPSEEEDSIWNDIRKATGFVKKSYTGTCFRGRLLISMTISSNDEPETGISKASPYREPVSKLHQLRVTLYEMKNAGDCGDKVIIKLVIGQHYDHSRQSKKQEKIDPATKESMYFFMWGSSYAGEAINDIKEPFPIDPTQVPDIFLNLYSIGLMGEKRIGYIRKPVTEIIGNDYPMWIPFKSIDTHSNIGQASPGLLLVSFSYGIESEDNNRGAKIKPRKVDKWLCWNIYGGLDMAPQLDDSDTNLFIKVYCGDCVKVMPKNTTSSNSHKFPIWKWTGVEKIQLHEDLHFEQNMRIEVHNSYKILKVYESSEEIGQFSIPLHACEKKWTQPHFFHVVNSNEEGVSQGRIIAEFFISSQFVDQSMNPCAENLKMVPCDVEVALLGVRGLKPPYEKLKMDLEIPGYKLENGQPALLNVEIGKESGADKSNPNILKLATFKGVMLPKKIIYLPAIHIRMEDEAFLSRNKSFTYISLINYCDWVTDELEKRNAIEQYRRHFTEKELLEQIPSLANEEKKVEVNNPEDMTDYGSENEIDMADEEYLKKKLISMEEIFEPKNSKICKKIQFDKTKFDESEEIKERERALEEKQTELDKVKNLVKVKMEKKGAVPEEIKVKQRGLEKEIESINLGIMMENVFLKRDDEFEDDGGFQYNRPIYKNGLLDDIQTPPYQRFPLYKKSKNSEKLSLFRVGEPIGAVLKATVHIKRKKPSKKDVEFQDPEEMNWDFNFFHPLFDGKPLLIEKLQKIDIVVRVYLLRALSLCAVDNASDLPAIAAGLEALSSASSYPEIHIGEKQLR